jgi:hypothetical protein
MFDHPMFRTYQLKDVPLDEDVFLMDEQWMAEYESSMIKMFNGGDYPNVGYISYAALRQADEFGIDISWYPNIYDRFHEVRVRLPSDQFITCVDCWQYGEKPHVFIRDGWLKDLHLRPFSVFALIDVIGVKEAIKRQTLTADKLASLRARIDTVADDNSDVCFVTFADSLLLKSNWSVGTFDSEINYTYEPEALIKLFPTIASIYKEVLGLDIYAVVAQGTNEYYDEYLLHISKGNNHICLNSIGLPFAQLLAIDNAVRDAIRRSDHKAYDLYLDSNFYHSLRFRFGFNKHDEKKALYHSPLSATVGTYYLCPISKIISNLDPEPPARARK